MTLFKYFILYCSSDVQIDAFSSFCVDFCSLKKQDFEDVPYFAIIDEPSRLL